MVSRQEKSTPRPNLVLGLGPGLGVREPGLRRHLGLLLLAPPFSLRVAERALLREPRLRALDDRAAPRGGRAVRFWKGLRLECGLGFRVDAWLGPRLGPGQPRNRLGAVVHRAHHRFWLSVLFLAPSFSFELGDVLLIGFNLALVVSPKTYSAAPRVPLGLSFGDGTIQHRRLELRLSIILRR